MELRGYQLEAAAAIERELTSHRSTLLVLPTGCGKTVTFGEVARRTAANGGRVLVIAHRSELLEQAARTLQRFGLSTGVEQAEQRVDRLFAPDVTIASVQTLQRKRLESFAPDAFALLIVDETHHAVATTYRRILDHFSSAKVLGVTATPDRSDKVGLRNIFESVAFTYEIGAAIKAGYLCPIELRTVIVESLDLSALKTRSGDFENAELQAAMVNDSELLEQAQPLAELSAGRQTLAFVTGVQHAENLTRVLQGLGVKAAAVSGEMRDDDRKRVLADYSAGRVQIVANAMLLTEGYDEPRTSCVALLRPTRSRSLLAQQIGRGLRLAEGKTECLLLDFHPSRAPKLRLRTPADVLAGEDLPDELVQEVSARSAAKGGDLSALIDDARERAEQQRSAGEKAERRRIERLRANVAYTAHALNVDDLLEALSEPGEDVPHGPPASASQIVTLKGLGFAVDERLTRRGALKLFEITSQRRQQGLCSIKQAKVLRKYGLPHDASFDEARSWLDELACNRWRPTDRLREIARERAASAS
jgi:superfamily II DNA or RNA helicase